MARSSVVKPFLRTVSVFAFLGPLFGTMTVWAVLLLAVLGGDQGDSAASPFLGGLSIDLAAGLAGFALLSILIGYGIGIIPAALAGVICHSFARAIRSDPAWVAACIFVGAASGALAGFIFTRALAPELAIFAVPGAVSAAFCSLLLRRRRWN